MGSLNKEGSLTFKLSKLGRVTTTPPPPYPKEGYLPSPRPPPDIGRGLNRTYSVLIHLGTLDPSKARLSESNKKIVFLIAERECLRRAASKGRGDCLRNKVAIFFVRCAHLALLTKQSLQNQQILGSRYDWK